MLRTPPTDTVAEPRDRPRAPGPVPRSPVADVSGSNCCTNDSNGVNDVATAGRSYFGGLSEANARATVDLPTPDSRATCRCGTPYATSRRINAHSFTAVTHPICLGGDLYRSGTLVE